MNREAVRLDYFSRQLEYRDFVTGNDLNVRGEATGEKAGDGRGAAKANGDDRWSSERKVIWRLDEIEQTVRVGEDYTIRGSAVDKVKPTDQHSPRSSPLSTMRNRLVIKCVCSKLL